MRFATRLVGRGVGLSRSAFTVSLIVLMSERSPFGFVTTSAIPCGRAYRVGEDVVVDVRMTSTMMAIAWPLPCSLRGD